MPLNVFVKNLLRGSGDLEKLPKPISINKVDKWDGKDA